jgi:protein-disulfide isomerase
VSRKAWLIFAAVCVLLLGALIAVPKGKKLDVSNVDTNKIQTASVESGNIAEHVFGKADSKVLFTEYGDYQCPGCGGMYDTVKTLTEKYQGQMAFAFRNFPLTTIHPNALTAASAAEAAGLQNKYWEMHDALYINQKAWEGVSVKDRLAVFSKYAEQIGLDLNKFKTDLASENVAKKISYDMAIGKKINVNSTPTFYLNGTELPTETWGDPAKLEAAIVAELKKNNIALPEATKE